MNEILMFKKENRYFDYMEFDFNMCVRRVLFLDFPLVDKFEHADIEFINTDGNIFVLDHKDILIFCVYTHLLVLVDTEILKCKDVEEIIIKKIDFQKRVKEILSN